MEEFREGSKCDPWIVQALAIDLPQEDSSQADDDWPTYFNFSESVIYTVLHVHIAGRN